MHSQPTDCARPAGQIGPPPSHAAQRRALSAPRPHATRGASACLLAAVVIGGVACAGIGGAPSPAPSAPGAWRVEARAPDAWGSPEVVTTPDAGACGVIWETRWRVDGAEHEPARLRLWTYTASQIADPEDEPFGLTAKDKAAAIDALQRLWDTRGIDHTLRPPKRFGPELAVRGLFWGHEDTFTLAHAWAYAQADGGTLRGLRVLGTEGQDDGLAPDLRVWLGRPAERVVLELRVPLPPGQLAEHQARGPDGILAGAAALRELDRARGGPIGARLTQADALLDGLRLHRP